MTKTVQTATAMPLLMRRGAAHAERSSYAVPLALIILLGLALRLYRLDAVSFWSDEAFSAHWVRRDLLFLLTKGLLLETTPPLYYLLLKGWVALAGSSDFAVRLFSALASTATIPLVFVLARAFGPPAAALTAALLFALMPMQVFYAQEARVYAMLPLLFSVALLGLLRFTRAAMAPHPVERWQGLTLYGIGAVLLIYSHATSVFTVAALSCCSAMLLLTTPKGRAALPRLIAVNLVAAILAVPQLWAIIMQTGRFDVAWIQPPDLVALLNVVNTLLVDPITPQSAFRLSCILSALLMAPFLVSLVFLRPSRYMVAFLLGVPAVFMAVTIGLSLKSPFLIPRITIWIAVPICVLAGLALQPPVPRWLRAVLVLAFAGCISVGLYGVYARTPTDKEDWRGVMAEVMPQLAPQDIVAIGPDTSVLPLLHYSGGAFEGTGRQIWRWVPETRQPDIYLPNNILPPLLASTEALAAEAQQGRRIWLLLREGDWLRHAPFAMLARPPPARVDRSHSRIVLITW
jgi:mannosyltransferase